MRGNWLAISYPRSNAYAVGEKCAQKALGTESHRESRVRDDSVSKPVCVSGCDFQLITDGADTLEMDKTTVMQTTVHLQSYICSLWVIDKLSRKTIIFLVFYLKKTKQVMTNKQCENSHWQMATAHASLEAVKKQ